MNAVAPRKWQIYATCCPIPNSWSKPDVSFKPDLKNEFKISIMVNGMNLDLDVDAVREGLEQCIWKYNALQISPQEYTRDMAIIKCDALNSLAYAVESDYAGQVQTHTFFFFYMAVKPEGI